MFLWFSVRQTLLMIKLSHSHFVTRPIDSRLIPRDLMTRTNKRASAAACSSTVKKKLKRITINLCCPFTWIFMAQRVRRRESGSHKDTKDTQHPLQLGVFQPTGSSASFRLYFQKNHFTISCRDQHVLRDGGEIGRISEFNHKITEPEK